MPASTRTSGAAIASLICGLLFCVPFLTSLLAFIFGLVGISSTKNPNVRGRGMAIAGLILGILGLLTWGGGAHWFRHAMQSTVAERGFARTYVDDLLAGNLDADVAKSTDKVTHDDLQAMQQQAQPWGSLQNTYIFALPPAYPNGTYACFAVGVCQFAGGQHQLRLELTKDASGQLLVNSIAWTK